MRHAARRKEARSRLGAPQGALLEPCRRADRARPDQDDGHEGEGGQAARRADDHARPPRRPARPPAGDGVPALARRRAQAVRRGRAALQGPARRLHADHQDRPAPGRRGGDGLPRARRRGVRRRRSARRGRPSLSPRRTWRPRCREELEEAPEEAGPKPSPKSLPTPSPTTCPSTEVSDTDEPA